MCTYVGCSISNQLYWNGKFNTGDVQEAPLMEKNWEVMNELYRLKGSSGPVLVEQTFFS